MFIMQVVVSLKAPMKDIKNFVFSNQNNLAGDDVIHLPTVDEFVETLTDDTVVKSLFPNNVMVFSWKPYRPMQCNLSYVHGLMHISWTKNAEGSLSLVTSTQVYPVHIGLRVNIDLHGTNIDVAEYHIQCSLASVCKSYPDFDGEVHLILAHPEDMVLPERQLWREGVQWQNGAYAHLVQRKLIIKWTH